MVFAIFNFHWGDGTSQSAWPLQVSDGTFHFAWYLPGFGHDSFGPSTFISHGARTSWTLSLPFLHGVCSIGRLRISFCTVHVTLWDFRLCMIFGTLWSVCFQILGGNGDTSVGDHLLHSLSSYHIARHTVYATIVVFKLVPQHTNTYPCVCILCSWNSVQRFVSVLSVLIKLDRQRCEPHGKPTSWPLEDQAFCVWRKQPRHKLPPWACLWSTVKP